MATDSNDSYGLNKLARLRAQIALDQITSDDYLPEPSFPFSIQPITSYFWSPTLATDNSPVPGKS
jgi:hypothetical protein